MRATLPGAAAPSMASRSAVIVWLIVCCVLVLRRGGRIAAPRTSSNRDDASRSTRDPLFNSWADWSERMVHPFKSDNATLRPTSAHRSSDGTMPDDPKLQRPSTLALDQPGLKVIRAFA